MSNTLVARALGAGAYEWVRGGREDHLGHPERGDAAALTAAAQSRSVSLLVDGREVRVLEASIPARSQRQAQQAAPFAIEEEVADELAQLHVVCGAIGASGKRAVAVIRQDTVRVLVEPMVAAGAQIAKLLPDFLTLPHRPEYWSLLLDDTRILVRTGPQQGFASDLDLFDCLAARLVSEPRPIGLDLFGECPVPGALLDIPQHRHALPHGTLKLLATGAEGAHTLDVLPPNYRANLHHRAGGLRLAAGFLLLALGVHAGFLVHDTQRLDAALVSARAAQAVLMARAFPEITRVVNAEIQATQAVTELRAQRGQSLPVLTMLHIIGGALRLEGDTLSLENLNYADGILSLRLAAPDIASLERYREALKPQVQVDVVAVEARGTGVGGSLRVQSARGTP